MTDTEKLILEKLDKLLTINKRTETKVTHSLEVQGINTTDTIKDEINPSKVYIKRIDDKTFIEVLNKDVSIAVLEKYLDNKYGIFELTCGDKTLWTIRKS